MKILMISDWGGSLALALRFVAEGHDVRMWIKDVQYQDVGDGLVAKLATHEDALEWAEFAVTDDIGLAEIAEALRARGITVWGGTAYSDRLELDRAFGQKEFEAAGLRILPRHQFTTVAEASEYLQRHPARYVLKPDGTAQEDKILTYVGRAEDGSDVRTFLDHLQKQALKSGTGKHSLTSFELQEFKAGVEIGISGFFNGKDFVEPIEVTFEHKKLMTGDIGPATFEMGTTMFWTTRASKLYRETIGKMTDRLRGYVGYFDINCICYEDTMYPLEATCRFGYPTIFLHLESLDGNLGEAMCHIARGDDWNIPTRGVFAACVVIATPPWPYASPEVFAQYGENTMVVVQGGSGVKLPSGVYPGEIRFADGDLYTAGTSGFSVITAGFGASIEEALRTAYDRVGLVNIPNMMFRTDIGATWNKDRLLLRKWGWLEGSGIESPMAESY